MAEGENKQQEGSFGEPKMASIEYKIKQGITVDASTKARYEAQLNSMAEKPVIETDKGESLQDLADAKKILGEDQGIKLPEQKLTHDQEAEPEPATPVEESTDSDVIDAEFTEGEDKKGGSKDSSGSYIDRILEMTPGQMRDKLASDWLGKNGETADSDLQRRVFASLGQAAPAREPAQVDWSKAEEGFDRLVNPLSYGGNPGQRKAAAERWLRSYGEETSVTDEMRDQLNKIINPEMDFADDLKEWVREFCLESVFERNAQNYHNVLNLLVGPGGALNTEKNIPLDKLELLKPEIQKIVEELGLDNFISIRNTISEWDSIKKLEEITSSALKSALFVPEYTEKWFEGDYDKGGIRIGDKMVVLPGENGVAKNMQEEVSEAILKLKNFFDNNDYWEGFVGVAQDKKANLYKQLGLNKYVGEVAFAMGMSNLIFTDTKGTSLDPFLYMVHGDTKRRKARDVAVDREITARAFVQYQMANNNRTPSADEIEVWLSQHFPSHLIPTGLSGEGTSALENGNWLEWRVRENLYSGAQRAIDVTYETNKDYWIRIANGGFSVGGDVINWTEAEVQAEYNRRKRRTVIGAKGRLIEDGIKLDAQKAIEKKKDKEWKGLVNAVTESGEVHIATDTETRVLEMQTALDLLTALKDALKIESDIDKIGVLKSKCLIHWKTSMKAAGFVDGNDMIDKEFSFIPGNKQSVDEWVSSAVTTACESFLHSHSIADFKNSKPWDMKILAEKAEQILATDVQTPDIQAYLWMGKDSEKTEPLLTNKKQYLRYVDSLWDDCFDVIQKLIKNVDPKSYPKWWGAGVNAQRAIVEIARKSDPFRALWKWNSSRWPR